MLSSKDIRQALLTTTSLKEGYDPAQVRLFLARVSETLSRLESGHTTAADGQRLMEPKELLQQRFLGTKFRDGYDVAEVQALLNQAHETLNEYVQMAVTGTLPKPTTESATPAAPAAAGSGTTGPGPAATGWLRNDIVPVHAVPTQSVPTQAVPTQAVPTHTVPTRNPLPASASQAKEPAPAGMRGGDVLRELQYTRATMFGDARETLTVRTPDGQKFGVASIERTDSGVVVHLANP